MKKIVHYFPLEFIHAGTTLGNGELGLSVWGEGRTLNLSLGNSALWDHRGGMSWLPKQNFRDIRTSLETNDEPRLRSLFAVDAPDRPNYPPRPSTVPLGRIEITLPENTGARRAELHPDTGLIEIVCRRGKDEFSVRFVLSQLDKGAFAFESDEPLACRVHPSFELSDCLAKVGFAEPAKFSGKNFEGFVQNMPADPSFGVILRRQGKHAWGGRFARAAAPDALQALPPPDFAALAAENRTFWRKFWKRVPAISTPEPQIDELYRLGLFKFQSMTSPDGCPAGLQGPWIEDDAFPPWSSDYHFNINVEMCYWPAFHSGLWENLMPMFRMVLSWREKLRYNAKCFVGIDDGYMMPHAVDDRCVCMGSFWPGCIDHACAAWIAQMMFDYVRCSGDVEFLHKDAFDFMRGVMRVYEAMLEEHDGKLVLPASVSPEYRGDQMNAWGANPSFQLAAIHRLANDLCEAAAMLDKKPAPAWKKIQEQLPQATLIEVTPGQPEIALWQGTMLEESHRHHSHLAALCPFNTIQPDDPEWRDIVANSKSRWVGMGMGRWAGWSMPWAVMLHNRLGDADLAATLISFWKRCYTNRGGGTLHDPQFPGISLGLCGNNRVMQMDAGMGMVAAIADLFLYESAGVIHALHGVPAGWEEFEVKRIHCPGGFLFSAKRHDGVTTAEFTATRDAHLRLECAGKKYERDLAAGKTFTFKA